MAKITREITQRLALSPKKYAVVWDDAWGTHVYDTYAMLLHASRECDRLNDVRRMRGLDPIYELAEIEGMT